MSVGGLKRITLRYACIATAVAEFPRLRVTSGNIRRPFF